MSRDPASGRLRGTSLLASPWFLVGVGLGGMVLGWLVGATFEEPPALVRLLLLFGGLLAVGVGLTVRSRQPQTEFVDRIETAALLSVAGLGCLAGYFGMHTWTLVDGKQTLVEDWVSGRILFAALFIAALLGVVLVLLPPLGRRVVLSLVVVFHFGGMVTAVTSVDPPGSTGPWVSKQLWSRVYYPYLSFLYLTNAYHFYSPDPGPPSLFWFAVCYDDGSYTWVKLPERSNSPVYMHYQRMLALPEHTFSAMPRLPFNQYEMTLLGDKVPPEMRYRGSWEMILQRRQIGSTRDYILMGREGDKKVERHLPIPVVLGMIETLQYREPHDLSKLLIEKVARRVYWNAPPPPEEGVKIKSVKVYRVVHNILTPSELARGVNPLEKTKHWPYFLGEFDSKGKLVDSLDPFLYWYLPITYVPDSYPGGAGRIGVPTVHVSETDTKDGFLLDSLEMHAAGLFDKAKKEEKQ
jgi:hypothetical protein